MNLSFAFVAALAVAPCIAQKQTSVTFDITSVKPAQRRDQTGSIKRLDADTISVTSMTVRDLIENFYNRQGLQPKRHAASGAGRSSSPSRARSRLRADAQTL